MRLLLAFGLISCSVFWGGCRGSTDIVWQATCALTSWGQNGRSESDRNVAYTQRGLFFLLFILFVLWRCSAGNLKKFNIYFYVFDLIFLFSTLWECASVCACKRPQLWGFCVVAALGIYEKFSFSCYFYCFEVIFIFILIARRALSSRFILLLFLIHFLRFCVCDCEWLCKMSFVLICQPFVKGIILIYNSPFIYYSNALKCLKICAPRLYTKISILTRPTNLC